MAAPRTFTVVATVPTGLERGAAEECREILGKEAAAHRGSITCTLEAVEELSKVYFAAYSSSINVILVVPTV